MSVSILSNLIASLAIYFSLGQPVLGAEEIAKVKILKTVGAVKLNGRRTQEKVSLEVGDTIEVAKGSSYADLQFKESYFRLMGGKFTIEKQMQKKQGKRIKFRLEEGELYFWYKPSAKPEEENIRLNAGKVELVFHGAIVKKDAVKPGKESSSNLKPAQESQFLFINDNKVIGLHVHSGSVQLQKKIKKNEQANISSGFGVSLSKENPDIKIEQNEERFKLRMNRVFEEFHQIVPAKPAK